MSDPVGIVGGGAWGTALATVLVAAGAERVDLWVRNAGVRALIEAERRHPSLGEARLPGEIVPVADLSMAAAHPLVVMAVPAQATRETLGEMARLSRAPGHLVLTAKGIERGTGALQAGIAREILPASVPLVLSGPSFAVDVAAGLPTAVTLAADPVEAAEAVAERFATLAFRPYASSDVAGVQLGGALKNIYAIAAGIVVGRGFGDSARAALIARSIAELTRLAVALGALADTVAGLSGLGDLVLTATSEKSRNFRFGLALARGAGPEAGWQGSGEAPGHPPLVEGAATAEAAVALARGRGIALPVAEAVADVLAGAASIDEAAARLMRRPLRREGESRAG